MKKLIILFAVIVSALAGCKTQQQTSTVAYDDVYANPKHPGKVAVQTTKQDMDLSAPQQISTPDSSSRVKSGSGTWYDEYSDNAASSGNQQPSAQPGSASNPDDSYVDPNAYDNTYSSNPDVNIYVGSSYDPFFWGSSVSIGYGFGWGWDSYYWGSPYSYWYYPYYGYYPYSSYGWGGYSYWNGYWDGYHDGFWDGHSDGYGSYSNPSHYYGQRRMLSSGSGGSHFETGRIVQPGNPSTLTGTPGTIDNQRNSKFNERTAGTKSIGQQGTERVTPAQERRPSMEPIRNDATTRKGDNKIPADRQHYQYERINQNPAPVNPRNGTGSRNTRTITPREQPSPRYSRTEQRPPATRNAETQNYSSPSYRQPKYSQEYINPRNQGNSFGGTREQAGTRKTTPNVTPGQNRTYSTPSSSGRRVTTPSNMNNSRSYSTPSRSNSSGFSSPSRSSSGSSGTHSSGSGNYSSPSRSSSTPSNSGGNGGGGRRK